MVSKKWEWIVEKYGNIFNEISGTVIYQRKLSRDSKMNEYVRS